MKINLNCAINNLSYGLVGLNFLKELTDEGVDVSLFPVNPHNIEAESKYHNYINYSMKNALDFDYTNTCLKIYHQFALAEHIGRGPFLGFPIFELDRFTKLEQQHIKSCDAIIVPSKWAKEVIDQYNVPSFVCPLGVDLDTFKPPTKERSKTKTIFTTIGKWEYRKSHKEIIECFNLAFDYKDNVELWMICENGFLRPEQTEEWHNLIKNSKLNGKIKILPRQATQNDVKYILGQSHFLLCPSRAEGWNLPALEAMACGTIPIVSNVTAHTEFCTQDNSFLVDFTEKEQANDGIWFKPGGLTNDGYWAKWNQNSIDQFVNYLRLGHNFQQDKSIELKRKECIKTAQTLSWKESAKTLIKILSRFD